MPGILAGALMAFALSIDDFVTSNFVSGAAVPFPVWVYGATRIGIPPQVFVFGTRYLRSRHPLCDRERHNRVAVSRPDQGRFAVRDDTPQRGTGYRRR